MWTRLVDAFHRPNTPIGRRTERAVWWVILVSLVPLVVDVALGSMPWPFLWLDRLVVGLFVVEYALRLATAPIPHQDFYRWRLTSRWRHAAETKLRVALRPTMLIDLLAIMGHLPVLRGLRALRLLRLIRLRQVLRYADPFNGMLRAFEENALLFGFGLSAFFLAVVVGGLSFYLAEWHDNPDINTLADGLWWAIVTLTTVGYGDLTPVTVVGRVTAGAVMVAGMGTLALFAGIVSSTLLGVMSQLREEHFRMGQTVNHVVICGYEPGTRQLLDSVLNDVNTEESEVVIFAPGERPHDIPPACRWIEGDPTKESELPKARMESARAVIVVGSRAMSPQQADAKTLLTLFTVRRYAKRHPDAGRRAAPLYLIAEVLDEENVEHARAAGADEVIESNRIGFSLIAHAVSVHGTGTLIAEFADARGHSLFVCAPPAGLPVGADFCDASRILKQQHGAILLGFRPAAGPDVLSPPAERALEQGDQLILLATKPL